MENREDSSSSSSSSSSSVEPQEVKSKGGIELLSLTKNNKTSKNESPTNTLTPGETIDLLSSSSSSEDDDDDDDDGDGDSGDGDGDDQPMVAVPVKSLSSMAPASSRKRKNRSSSSGSGSGSSTGTSMDTATTRSTSKLPTASTAETAICLDDELTTTNTTTTTATTTTKPRPSGGFTKDDAIALSDSDDDVVADDSVRKKLQPPVERERQRESPKQQQTQQTQPTKRPSGKRPAAKSVLRPSDKKKKNSATAAAVPAQARVLVRVQQPASTSLSSTPTTGAVVKSATMASTSTSTCDVTSTTASTSVTERKDTQKSPEPKKQKVKHAKSETADTICIIEESDSDDDGIPGPAFSREKRQLTTRKPILPMRDSGKELPKDSDSSTGSPAIIQPLPGESVPPINKHGPQATPTPATCTTSKPLTESNPATSAESRNNVSESLTASSSAAAVAQPLSLSTSSPGEVASKAKTKAISSLTTRPMHKHKSAQETASQNASSPTKTASRLTNNSRNGSHLAPIFASALAQGKILDVRDVPISAFTSKRERRLRGIITKQKDSTATGPIAKDDDQLVFPVRARPIKAAWTSSSNSTSTSTIATTSTQSRKRPLEAPTHQLMHNEHTRSDAIDPPIPRGHFRKTQHDLNSMNKIDFLSSTTIDPTTGLPVYKFSVFGSPDDIIYDFKIEARTSTIPNSGNGAFLTFLRARELKPSAKKRNESAWEKREPRLSAVGDVLTAKLCDGRHASVKLVGDHLHSLYNCHFLVPDSVDEASGMANRNFHTYYSREEISGFQHPSDRIGVLKLNKESDFIPAPNRTFSSLHKSCGLINIGRYGPFRKSDRKCQATFDMKSFIFAQEPSEWGFGVDEPLCGAAQIIDITDDLTGKPSKLAQQNIPMYVNEVGHNDNLKHTVHSMENNDRSVEYYLKIDTPMKQGETMEIFVNYLDDYEPVRERKGYGLANIERGEKSDDDPATRIRRNFVERDEMPRILTDMNLMTVHEILEWLDSVHEQLAEIVQAFVDKTLKSNSAPSDCPLALQIVALRRLHWLARKIQHHLDLLTQNDPTKKLLNEIGAKFRSQITSQCENAISNLCQFPWSTLYDVVSGLPNLNDKDGVNIKQSFEAEMIEEICYEVKDTVKAPLDGSIWCGIATDLTKRLCLATASIQWRNEGDDAHTTTQLMQCYQAEALRAARLICSRTNPEELAFHGPFDHGYGIDATGLTATALSSLPAAAKVVIQRVGAGSIPKNGQESGLQATAKEITKVETLDIQETWYLCWQVILIVDAFSCKFLKKSPYALKDLCSILGVDHNLALSTIQKGIKLKDKVRIQQPQRAKPTSRPSIVEASSARPRAKTPAKSNASAKTTTTTTAKSKLVKFLFWNIIWECLRDQCGWHLQKGNRPHDCYFCPPGVTRGAGFKPRVDFFDSTSQIMDVLKRRRCWAEQAPIKAAVAEFNACSELYHKLKGTAVLKGLGTDEAKCKWLRSEAQKKSSS